MLNDKHNNSYSFAPCKNLKEMEIECFTYPSCSMHSTVLTNEDITEKKKNVFEHIFYEIDMLINCKKEIEQLRKESNKDNQYYINILHTSSMTYLRNLIYFFFPNIRNPDDIFYTTILKDYSLITPIDKTLKDNCEQEISKNIHHITEKRLEENEYKNMEKFFDNAYIIIIDKCKTFLKQLSMQNVNNNYIQQLKDYEKEKNDLLNKLNNL